MEPPWKRWYSLLQSGKHNTKDIREDKETETLNIVEHTEIYQRKLPLSPTDYPISSSVLAYINRGSTKWLAVTCGFKM